MKQTEVAKWLKGITAVIALMGAVFFFFLMPVMADEMRTGYPEVSFLYWPGMIYGWVIAVFCYAILFQFWKVCVQIGRDNSFSEENAQAFVKISRLALWMGGFWFLGMFVLVMNRWMNPGIGILMITATLLSVILAILAAALSHLILKAYELKRENELTI